MATHSSVLAWDGGAWWAAVCGVTWSWTRLKQLSSSRFSEIFHNKFLKHTSFFPNMQNIQNPMGGDGDTPCF